MKIQIGMMVQNDTMGIVGRVVYTDNDLIAVETFMGDVHELATDECEEVSTWVRILAWINIAKRLRSFFIPRTIKLDLHKGSMQKYWPSGIYTVGRDNKR